MPACSNADTGVGVSMTSVSQPCVGNCADFSTAATASDTEDGDLTANIAWTSSLDGAIGTGGSFGSGPTSDLWELQGGPDLDLYDGLPPPEGAPIDADIGWFALDAGYDAGLTHGPFGVHGIALVNVGRMYAPIVHDDDILGVFAERRLSAAAQLVDAASNGALTSVLAQGDLDGKAGGALMLHAVAGIAAQRVLLVNGRGTFTCRPSPDGRRLILGGPVGQHPVTPERDARGLHDYFTKIFPDLAGIEFTHCWSGFIAGTLDGRGHSGGRVSGGPHREHRGHQSPGPLPRIHQISAAS